MPLNILPSGSGKSGGSTGRTLDIKIEKFINAVCLNDCTWLFVLWFLL